MSTRRRKRHSPEQIVKKLRDGEAVLNAGKDLASVLVAVDVYELIPVHDPAHHVRQAVRAGVVRKGLPADGWVPTTPATAPI